MNSKVGAASVTSLGGVTIGAGFSSGWGKSYNFTNSPTNYKVTEIETVKVTDNTESIKSTLKDVESIIESDPNLVTAFVAFLAENFTAQKKFLDSISVDDDALKVASKQFFKDTGGLLTAVVKDLAKKGGYLTVLGGEIFGTVLIAALGGALGKNTTNLYAGKGFADFKYEFLAAGAKALPKAGVSCITLSLTYFSNYCKKIIDDSFTITSMGMLPDGVDPRKAFQTDAVKIFDNFMAKSALSNAKDVYSGMEVYKSLEQTLKDEKALVGYDGLSKKGKKIFDKAHKGITDQMRRVKDKVELEAKIKMHPETVTGLARMESGKAFLRNYAAGMGVGIAVDAAVYIVGNILKAKLVDGKSWSESLANCQWGAETLKASCRGVCGTAGGIIGAALGNAKLGKTIGTVIGTFVGELAVKPFTLEDGTVQQEWCFAAGCAVVGGAVVGGIVTAAIICGASGPIGWVVGVGMIAGAAIGYAVVWLVHLFW